MPEILIGQVTEVGESRESGGKKYIDVWVAVGRRTVRTNGPDGTFNLGETLILKGNSYPDKFNAAEVAFNRQAVLQPAEAAALIGLRVAPAAPAPVAKAG